jgi:proline iminopeptidase
LAVPAPVDPRRARTHNSDHLTEEKLNLPGFQEGTMKVSVNGAELFYSTRGSGPVCFVLCSMGTEPQEWLTSPALRGRFRLVYVDLRGSGLSTGEPAGLTFDVLAEDLEAVRADLGVERVAVLGHSILGALAIEYGRRRPEVVSHVITAGTPPFGDMARVLSAAQAFFEKDASEDRKRILRENLAKLPPGASPGRTMLAQTPMRFFDASFDASPMLAGAVGSPRFFQNLWGPLTSSWDVTRGAASMRVPLFLAHGRYDYVVPYVLWDGVAEKLPGATFQVFQRSGHQPFFEEPERFAATVTDWMTRQG